MKVAIKRVYEKPDATDGFRVLVDRLWPRGVSKEHAQVDEWLKDVGPSNDLRKWFGHVPDRFGEFATRYRAELATSESLSALTALVADHENVTLVYSAKDEEHNQAVVLRDVLEGA
jgi:DNA-3-methyladenine glycosylase